MTDGYDIAVHGFKHGWFFLDCTCSEYGYLGLVYYRCAHQTSKRSYIGDGKRASTDFIRF